MRSRLDETFAALTDPNRRQLLQRIALGPRHAGELATGFAISRPAICKHTRVLKRAGLIRASQHGRERLYELAPSGGHAIEELIGALKQLERFWDTALSAFKRYAETTSQPAQPND